MSSGKLFQTASVACEKAWSAKARLVRSSCSKFLLQDLRWCAYLLTYPSPWMQKCTMLYGISV